MLSGSSTCKHVAAVWMPRVNAHYNPAKPRHTPDGFKNSGRNSYAGKGVDFSFTPVQHGSAHSLGNLTDEPLDQRAKNLALALRERGLAADTFTLWRLAKSASCQTARTLDTSYAA